jgi:hypothetical protein
MTRKQAHQIYQQVKKDLSGKTIMAWGKIGLVVKVYEHYGVGAVCLVKFENGTEGMVHPTRDEVDIIETYYTISSEEILKAATA